MCTQQCYWETFSKKNNQICVTKRYSLKLRFDFISKQIKVFYPRVHIALKKGKRFKLSEWVPRILWIEKTDYIFSELKLELHKGTPFMFEILQLLFWLSLIHKWLPCAGNRETFGALFSIRDLEMVCPVTRKIFNAYGNFLVKFLRSFDPAQSQALTKLNMRIAHSKLSIGRLERLAGEMSIEPPLKG